MAARRALAKVLRAGFQSLMTHSSGSVLPYLLTRQWEPIWGLIYMEGSYWGYRSSLDSRTTSYSLPDLGPSRCPSNPNMGGSANGRNRGNTRRINSFSFL